jgi:hypothetical protein
MPRKYIKTKDCGCVIIATSCGIKNNSDSKMYMLGGHKHLIICDTCKKMEDDDDTLWKLYELKFT